VNGPLGMRTCSEQRYLQRVEGLSAFDQAQAEMRAGMGAHFGLSLVEGAESLDALQVPLLAASSHAERAIHEATLPWPCGWVMGHEGQGVSPSLMQRCAMTLRIPQPGGEESLNVSAAAAICMYETFRQRGT